VLEHADPLRPDVVDAALFDSQMKWVSRDFNVMPLHKAVDLLKKGKLPTGTLSITFDDGYLDALTVATPILKKYGLTASFYISTDFVGKNEMWLDKLTYSLHATQKNQIKLNDQLFKLETIDQKSHFFYFAEKFIKDHSRAISEQLLDEVVADLGGYDTKRLLLNADEIKELRAEGMEIGAHGKKHFILADTNHEEAFSEINDSKAFLERLLQQDIHGFAVPNGNFPNDFTEVHSQMIQAANYQYAVSTNFGCSYCSDDLFKLKRFTPWRPSRLGFVRGMLSNYLVY
jgi:peptidoglycan/xylan/chitin deacetylase (PgdA/CDA1 family)